MTLELPTVSIASSRTHREPSFRSVDHPNTTVNGEGTTPSTYRVPDRRQVLYLDSFHYGYRDVRMFQNGKEVWEQVPLTLDDILHPQLGDYVAQTDYHALICMELYMILQSFLAPNPWMYVVHDVLVKWGVRNMIHAPDLTVFSGVTQQPVNVEGKVNVSELGWTPLLALEVTSPSTRRADINKTIFSESKYLQYEYIRVPYYVVVDQAHRRVRKTHMAPPIQGYRLVGKTYRKIIPDRAGRVWIEPLRLSLGHYQDRVAWFTAEGMRLLTHREERQRADQEAQARIAAELQAQQADARASAAEEELRQLKAKLGMS